MLVLKKLMVIKSYHSKPRGSMKENALICIGFPSTNLIQYVMGLTWERNPVYYIIVQHLCSCHTGDGFTAVLVVVFPRKRKNTFLLFSNE